MDASGYIGAAGARLLQGAVGGDDSLDTLAQLAQVGAVGGEAALDLRVVLRWCAVPWNQRVDVERGDVLQRALVGDQTVAHDGELDVAGHVGGPQRGARRMIDDQLIARVTGRMPQLQRQPADV